MLTSTIGFMTGGWLLGRLGYDRRAVVLWTPIALALVLVSYFFLPPPPAPADNAGLPVNVKFLFEGEEEVNSASLKFEKK